MRAEQLRLDQAWHALVFRPSAHLADVRTEPEWLYGKPDITGASKPVLKICWHVFPTMTVTEASAIRGKHRRHRTTLLPFLCPSGGQPCCDVCRRMWLPNRPSIAGDLKKAPSDDQDRRRGTREGWILGPVLETTPTEALTKTHKVD